MKYAKSLYLVLVGAAFFGAVFLMGISNSYAATSCIANWLSSDSAACIARPGVVNYPYDSSKCPGTVTDPVSCQNHNIYSVGTVWPSLCYAGNIFDKTTWEFCPNGCADNACINNNPTYSIKVTSPNGGETVTTGQNYKITWDSSTNIDKVWLGYSFGVGSLDWIATDLDNVGSYDWKVDIGNTINTQVKIRVIGFETGVGNADDESDNFFTVNPPNCTLDSAFWEPNEATQGQSVKLNVKGTNCDGKKLSFQVKENDMWFDDLAGGTLTATFVDGKATTEWVAQRGDVFGNSSYYFVATLDDPGVPTFAPVTITSDDLTVKPRSGSDTEAPKVTAFKISPSEVDTSSQEQEVKVTMTLTDNNSGVCIYDYGTYISCSGPGTSIYLNHPETSQSVFLSSFKRISGDELNGTYEGTAILPQGSAEGEWKASLSLADRLGNNQYFVTDNLETMFGAGAATIVNSAEISDKTPPEVTFFEITPKIVYTKDQLQEVTVILSLVDNNSGVCIYDYGTYISCSGPGTSIYLNHPETSQSVFLSSFKRISGDELNGTYEGTAILPQGSAEGEWKASLSLADRLGNNQYFVTDNLETMFGAGAATFNNTDGPVTTASHASGLYGKDLEIQLSTNVSATTYYSLDGSEPSLVYANAIDIQETAELKFFSIDAEGRREAIKTRLYTIDTDPPQVTAFELVPDEINTESQSQDFTIRISVEDESGLCMGFSCANINDPDWHWAPHNGIQIFNYSASSQGIVLENNEFIQVAGDEFNGTYELHVTLPARSAHGAWRVVLLNLFDNSGNYKYMKNEDIESQFGEGSSIINNVAGTSDITAPKIISFELSPERIDSTSVDQEITLSLTISDDDTGLCPSGSCAPFLIEAPLYKWKNGQKLYPVDYFSNFNRISGDKNDGVYSSTVTIKKGENLGSALRIDRLCAKDELNNGVCYFSPDKIEEIFGAGSATVVNEPQPCQLTGTAWNMTTASKGDTVEFHVIGSNCDGEAVNVRIMEDDVVDVPAQVQPTNVYIQGNTVTKTWVAEAGDAVGNSEYYTEAWLPSDTEKQNMITSSNKLVVSQEDTTPPLTSAYPAGGSHPAALTVTLSTNESATTYYTTDGTDPTISSTVLSGGASLNISAATTLKFFSVDTLGNTEAIKTEKYVIVPEQDNPIGHWKFDEESGNTALDSAGNNNGAITGASRTAGKIGGALSFGPGGDRVVLGNDPSLKVFPQKNWSFAAWINPTGTGDPWQTIFNGIWHKPWINFTPYAPEPDTDDGKENGVGFGFFPKKVERLSGSFLWRTRSAANAVTPNQWNHVAVTSDGANHKLFVNGELVGTSPYLEISDIDHPHFRTHGGYIIGNIIEFDAPQSSFSGKIDDVRIYNKTLSESEINALVQPGSDTTPPEITAFSLSPKEIDTSESDQEVTASIAVTDDISGACISPENQSCPEGPVQVQLQESNGNNAVSMYEFTRTSGDIFNGTYTGKVKVLKGSPAGIWKATLKLTDKAGNRTDISTADLETKFGAGAATVVNGTNQIDSIQVNSPNGGEFYKIGQTRRISWNATGVAQVRIYIYEDRVDGSGSTNYLTPNNEPVLAANGFFDWEIKATDIPSPLTDSDSYHYKIRLEGSDNNGNTLAEDVSDDYFAVVSELIFRPADANHDDVVNIKDIQNLVREIVGKDRVCITLAEYNCYADVNKDGAINIKDIQEIIKEIVRPK